MEKRRNRKPSNGGVTSLWQQLKASPIIFNAVMIVIVIVGIILLSSLAMSVITRHGTHRTVPDFSGIKIAEAIAIADDNSLEIIINDSLYVPAYEGGIVLEQLPKGGVEVKADRKIYVTINSSRQKMVEVPYVAGRSLRQAKNMLEVAGLEIEELVYEEDIATNYVLSQVVDGKEQQPDDRIEIEMGEGVVLKVGVELEKNSTIVPKAIGQSLDSAKSRLWEQGLNIGRVEMEEGINLMNINDARVYRQSIEHNATAQLGDAVSLWLTLDTKKVDSSSKASDERALELEEERLEAEQALRDSLEMVESGRVLNAIDEQQNPLRDALRQSSNSRQEITQTEEDEFF